MDLSLCALCMVGTKVWALETFRNVSIVDTLTTLNSDVNAVVTHLKINEVFLSTKSISPLSF